MKVFVLRHALTEDGKSGIHQKSTSVLSPDGIRQSQKIAENFAHLNIGRIFTSPDERTRQTATITGEHLMRNVEISSLSDLELQESLVSFHWGPTDVVHHDSLHEMLKPSFFVGKSHDDKVVTATKDEMYSRIADPDFRLPGSENIFDVRKRVIRILSELERYPGDNILLITHSALMRVMIMAVLSKLQEDFFFPELYPLIRKNLEIDNGKGFELSLQRKIGLRPEWSISFNNIPQEYLIPWLRSEQGSKMNKRDMS